MFLQGTLIHASIAAHLPVALADAASLWQEMGLLASVKPCLDHIPPVRQRSDTLSRLDHLPDQPADASDQQCASRSYERFRRPMAILQSGPSSGVPPLTTERH